MAARTPISYLLEVCSRRGITPQYDLIATEGRVHEPTFVFRCTAGPYNSTGKGTNKKIARHEAAYGVLQQMTTSEQADHPDIEIPSVPTADSEEPEMQNPVGKLQEIAQKNKWLPPTYEYDNDPETKDFVCTVTMAKMEEKGVGRSKKAAKKTAAKNLLRAVLDEDIPDDMRRVDEEDDMELPLTDSGMVLPPPRGTQDEEDAQTLDEIAEPHMVGLRLKNPSGSAVDSLKAADLEHEDLDQDYVEQLRTLAEEQNWIIQYHELPSPSDDVYLMLVEVSKIKPHTAVYHGQGATAESCKNRAARNMLDYIKRMILTEDREG